jgi:hypothetical protein
MIGFAASEAGGRFAHHAKKELDKDLDCSGRRWPP